MFTKLFIPVYWRHPKANIVSRYSTKISIFRYINTYHTSLPIIVTNSFTFSGVSKKPKIGLVFSSSDTRVASINWPTPFPSPDPRSSVDFPYKTKD